MGYNESSSFNIDDNRTEEEKDLIELRKRVKQLEMENDILKQATLSPCAKINIMISNREKPEVVVSDLTYVKVGSKWNYVCTIIDLYNREFIGYAAGSNKNAKLIETALFKR